MSNATQHMKVFLALWTIALLLLAGCSASPTVTIEDPWGCAYPTATLANERVALLVALPDEKNGFNRASRFDRAGLVTFASTRSGHSYFGPTQPPDKHDPGIDDHVAGTAGEFGINSPLGYDQARPGETFVKIGVGVLRRIDEEPYFFRRTYPLVDPGLWRLDQEPGRLVMTQDLQGHGGFSYSYRTAISLLTDRSGFTIERSLTNTGTQPIQTDHYCHNFAILDGQPVTPELTVSLGMAHTRTQDKPLPEWADFDGHKVAMRRVPTPTEVLWLPVKVSESSDAPWNATLARPEQRLRLEIVQTPLPSRVAIYANAVYFSVEPFIRLNLEPGHTQSWTATYCLDEPPRISQPTH